MSAPIIREVIIYINIGHRLAKISRHACGINNRSVATLGARGLLLNRRGKAARTVLHSRSRHIVLNRYGAGDCGARVAIVDGISDCGIVSTRIV